MHRQIVLDTETTGLDPREGHRIIEIGAVELINRQVTDNTFHYFINPEREVDAEALSVHNISNEFLQDKPVFADVAQAFLDFIGDDELVIHNAPFDLGFLNHELQLLNPKQTKLEQTCAILDTLVKARSMYPGQRNNLDALCKRLDVHNSRGNWHGALLDAELLARVYLAMTGGQVGLFDGFDTGTDAQVAANNNTEHHHYDKHWDLAVQKPTEQELNEHQQFLQLLAESNDEVVAYWSH